MDWLVVLLTSIPVALVTSFITAIATTFHQERKLRRDYKLEFAAERAASALLSMKEWDMRSLYMIKKRLGGFSDDELRRILVRAGAVQFHSTKGVEYWGLLERNLHLLDEEQVEVRSGAKD